MGQKGVSPYSYITDMEKFKETSLPPKEYFYDELRDAHISQADYNRACDAWSALGCNTLGDYSDMCLTSDVLLLADVFGNYRELCLKTYRALMMTRTKTACKSDNSDEDKSAPLSEELRRIFTEMLGQQTATILKELQEVKKELHDIKTLNERLIAENKRLGESSSQLNKSLEVSENSDELNDSTSTVIEKTGKCDPKTQIQIPLVRNVNKWTNHNNPRRSKTNKPAVGTGSATSNFAAAPKRLWMYIGRCKPYSTVDGIRAYLEGKSPGHTFDVVQLNTKGHNHTYRVEADFELRDTTSQAKMTESLRIILSTVRYAVTRYQLTRAIVVKGV
nr:unnamed protein product [Callosobruchus analis]